VTIRVDQTHSARAAVAHEQDKRPRDAGGSQKGVWMHAQDQVLLRTVDQASLDRAAGIVHAEANLPTVNGPCSVHACFAAFLQSFYGRYYILKNASALKLRHCANTIS
jgi:hypothetical protein